MSAYFDGWKRCFSFKGESTRGQFWTFSILNVLFVIVAYGYLTPILLLKIIELDFENLSLIATGINLFWTIFTLLWMIATWTISVRRLHDTGKSGWYLLLGFVPVLGWLILLVFFLSESKYGY